MHYPKSQENIGIASFYKYHFQELYQTAKEEYESFQAKQDNMVKTMQTHHEEIFSNQEAWESALERGDPMALVD